MKGNDIVRVVVKLVFPFVLLFAFYVQFHGDFGPGGGFQAGVIFAAAVVVYALVYGLNRTQQLFRPAMVQIVSALGVLLYAAVGLASMLFGHAFLDYDVLAHDPVHGQHYGILLVELGVGVTVTATMIWLFYSFAGFEHETSDK